MDKTKQILVERGQTYGTFFELAELAQELKKATFVQGADADMQESLDMICTKLARIVCGDETHADSWRDIAGYASLVADRLEADDAVIVPASAATAPLSGMSPSAPPFIAPTSFTDRPSQIENYIVKGDDK